MQVDDREPPYQRIFNAAGDGMILNDLETGLVVEANSAACTMHGYAHAEFIGQRPSAYIDTDTDDSSCRVGSSGS